MLIRKINCYFWYAALQSKSQEERQSYEKKLLEERRQKDSAIKKQTKVGKY